MVEPIPDLILFLQTRHGALAAALAGIILQIVLVIRREERTDYVDYAEAGVLDDLAERLVVVLRQNVVCLAFSHKENAFDKVTFIVYVFPRGRNARLEAWTNPGNKCLLLAD